MNAMSNFNWYSDFQNYCKNHMGISDMQFKVWDDTQKIIYSNGLVPSNNLTPYVPDEDGRKITMVDIFSRMMMDRQLFLVGPVNDQMSTVVSAQISYLDMVSQEDIIFNINTPGGSVLSGLQIVDTMNYINSDIQTINVGMAASMGSILLGAGTKGKRGALPHARVMLHQVSHGMQGNIQDTEISFNEGKKYNEELFRLLGEFCDKNPKKVLKDSTRDLWLNSNEALEYGIIDELVVKKS